MRANSSVRPRPWLPVGLLAVLLFCSPAEALRMLHTLRFMPIAALDGSCVGAKLRLHRKTPPLPIESTRPLVIRKADAVRLPVAFDRGLRESWDGLPEHAAVSSLRPQARLAIPDYLRRFFPSSPQRRVQPPAEPVPLGL